MMNILGPLYIFMLESVHYTICTSIDSEISHYFETGTVFDYTSKWSVFKASYESTISKALQYGYAKESVNVYVPFPKNDLTLSSGFHVSDNIVDVLCKTVKFREIPLLKHPEVTFDLPSNLLSVDADVGKMFLETSYQLFRSQASLLEQGDSQDPLKTSPFAFQQVQDKGLLTIVVEGCVIKGAALVTLVATSVAVGDDHFKLSDCQFWIEISTPGLGAPPVIAPYFSDKKRTELMRLITSPLRDSLVQKLQGSLFSLVNTSAIFADKLYKMRPAQQSIMDKTEDFITKTVGFLNRMTISTNRGLLQLQNFQISLQNQEYGKNTSLKILLSDATLNGLDTAYSSNAGGPFRTGQSFKITETIRFNSLQVRGKLKYDNSSSPEVYDFNVELSDVSIKVLLSLSGGRIKLESHTFTGWRSLDLSIVNFIADNEQRETIDAIISAYLLDQIPEKLEEYVPKAFEDAAIQAQSGTLKDTNVVMPGSNNEELHDVDNHSDVVISDNGNENPDKHEPDENNVNESQLDISGNDENVTETNEAIRSKNEDGNEPVENNTPYHEIIFDPQEQDNEDLTTEKETTIDETIAYIQDTTPIGSDVNNDTIEPDNNHENDDENAQDNEKKSHEKQQDENASENVVEKNDSDVNAVQGKPEANTSAVSEKPSNENDSPSQGTKPSGTQENSVWRRRRKDKKINIKYYRKNTPRKTSNAVISQSEEDINVANIFRSPNLQRAQKGLV